MDTQLVSIYTHRIDLWRIYKKGTGGFSLVPEVRKTSAGTGAKMYQVGHAPNQEARSCGWNRRRTKACDSAATDRA